MPTLRSLGIGALSTRNHSILSCVICLLLWTAATHPTPVRADGAQQPTAQQLIVQAAQAEIAGDLPKSVSLLNDALGNDPANQLAHWQLGELLENGKWMPVADSQRQAAADPLQAEYQRRRSADKNLQDQIQLARWCRDNKLNDEATLRWEVVLSLDANNKEAQHATETFRKNGRLVSREELAREKQRTQDAKDAAKHWDPIVAKWRSAVAGKDLKAHDAALAEIKNIQQVAAIPSVEAVTLGRTAFDAQTAEDCSQITKAFIEAIGKLPDAASTESLVRHAVLSPSDKCRELAIAQLKARPQTDYVPLLLSELKMPIESTAKVSTAPDGSVHYTHSLYREGQNADLSVDANYYTMQHVFHGVDYLYRRRRKTLEAYSTVNATDILASQKSSEAGYARKADAIEASVQKENEATEEISELIIPVLQATTEKSYESPKQWWDWWQQDNEYYAEGHPVDYRYYSGTDDRYYGRPYDTFRVSPSCFVQGTPVWTRTGKKPIEEVELGEFVLSQDIRTGELKYQPVIAKTVRPPSPTLRIAFDRDEIVATLGHPFWVTGVGWRMAKELGDDASVRCVTGSARIKKIEPAADAKAYNMIVGGFNSYFVGETGMLVHDNTPRHSVPVVLPGVVAVQ